MWKKINFERTAAVLFVLLCAGVSVFLGVRYILPALLPFVFAWGVAFSLRPMACLLHRRLHLPKPVASVSLVLLFMGLFFFVVYLLLFRMTAELKALLIRLKEEPHILEEFIAKINGFFENLRSFIPALPTSSGGEHTLETYLSDAFGRAISALLEGMPALLGNALLGVPGVFVFVLVTVVASVYFALDLEHINAAILSLFSQKTQEKIRALKKGILRVALRYAGAYAVLLAITFVLLLVGFLVIGVPYALLLSAVFALVDLLPILGVGTMLIPWGVFCFATGNRRLGLSLLVLYGIIAVIRQLAEPKILGKHLGVPPLLMLLCLYAGLSLFGFWGIFIGPVFGVALGAWLGKREEKTENTP